MIKDEFTKLKGRFDIDPHVRRHAAEDVVANENHLPANYSAYKHAHAYDHLTILAEGTAIVSTDKEDRVFMAPSCILIKAGIYHKITAVTDTTWYCVHREEDDGASI